MSALDTIELIRLTVQTRLDAAKTQEERNRLGQFATPSKLALAILGCTRALFPRGQPVRFLDPAIGTGAFYSALLRTFPAAEIADAIGYEIDPQYAQEARKLWEGTPLRLEAADFTKALPPSSDGDKANLLICNPPYVRHHHLSPAEKARLQALTERVCGIKLHGLAGLYCYFLCLSHAWLAKNALAGWLIPSEFMDVNYGRGVKEYLLRRVTLLRIHRFDPHDMQFGDALVSSAVVWYRNATPPADHAVEFTYGASLAEPAVSARVPVAMLRRAAKWTRFPLAAAPRTMKEQQLTLGDFFEIKRGVATGANEFFVLDAAEARRLALPAQFLVPILPSPRYLTMDEIEADERGEPCLEPRLVLLTCDLPEDAVRRQFPSLWAYLQRGVAQGVHERYLCMHREPWYAQERRPPAPYLCTYMGRSATKRGRAFRFILNHSQATAANVYLMLYPKPALRELLAGNRPLQRAVWEALKAIPPETLVGEGRVYGGGLYKLEPKELANAPADGLVAVLPAGIRGTVRQMALFPSTPSV